MFKRFKKKKKFEKRVIEDIFWLKESVLGLKNILKEVAELSFKNEDFANKAIKILESLKSEVEILNKKNFPIIDLRESLMEESEEKEYSHVQKIKDENKEVMESKDDIEEHFKQGMFEDLTEVFENDPIIGGK